MIARDSPCHCEERSDAAVSYNYAGRIEGIEFIVLSSWFLVKSVGRNVRGRQYLVFSY